MSGEGARRIGRDDAEAAYFALLRAREELTALRRYEDYLDEEERRLQRFVSAGDALEAHVDPRLRRGLTHTGKLLAEALKTRHEAIGEERKRLPDRIEAAEQFVEESEAELARIRSARHVE